MQLFYGFLRLIFALIYVEIYMHLAHVLELEVYFR